MKQRWEEKKLGEICDKASSNVSQNKLASEDGDYPIYGARGFIKNVSFYHQDKEYVSIIKDGAGIGKIALLPAYSSVIGTLQYLIPKKIMDIKYFYYLVNSIDFWKYKNGSTIPHIYFKDYAVEPILVPPLSEQKRLVKVLDGVFEKMAKAKENAEKNLQNARELFKSYLQNIFINPGDEWEIKRVGEVCELKSGTTISSSLERDKGDVLYTKIADMNLPENLIEINTSSRFADINEIKKNQIIPEGAIIFPKRGGAIATNKKRKIVKPTIVDLNTMAIIPGKKIDKNYLFFWFQLIDLNEISNGTSIPQINNYSFDEVYIPYPKSLPEQHRIVFRLDVLSTETKKLEAIYQQKLGDLEELKKSILQKAFNGELIGVL